MGPLLLVSCQQIAAFVFLFSSCSEVESLPKSLQVAFIDDMKYV